MACGTIFETYGIVFITPTIQQAIDFCNKLWMKYISPGVPLQVWDLDQQYIKFPIGILNEYKGTTKLSPDISYGPMSLSTFITSYQCIMQDKLNRNKTIYEKELSTWISEVHHRTPLANGLVDNVKTSWSNSAARFIALKEATSIEEFRSKPEFIDQKRISFLQQFISLPKTHIDRDKMRLFEIVEKLINISKLFRLSTSAYTFVPSIERVCGECVCMFVVLRYCCVCFTHVYMCVHARVCVCLLRCSNVCVRNKRACIHVCVCARACVALRQYVCVRLWCCSSMCAFVVLR